MASVTVTVDGTEYVDDVEPRLLLVHHLRDTLGLTGTNVGCDSPAPVRRPSTPPPPPPEENPDSWSAVG